ncbi:MAG: FKBP-type peptidyl-prolyl cis-trans isomerase [Ignavibacteriaceae bacterium]|jgi:peptidylprolyl isomerase
MKLFSSLLVLLLFVPACSKQHTGEVVKKPSGLEFMDDTLGTGKEAKAGDLVQIHFSAWIIKDTTNLFSDWSKDSTRISSSIGSTRIHSKPVKFVLRKNSFINGLDEGIEGMKEGGYRTIIIPSKLAYGERGMPPVIPPNASLKFQVQLLQVEVVITAKRWDVDSTKFQTLKDGLKYVVVKAGDGPAIDSGDVVTLHYSGYLEGGKKFDSSIERGEPLVVPYKIQNLIKGFNEAIGLMKKGEKAEFIIPPDLAYGSRGNSVIPANSTLIFDIEILYVAKPPKANEPPLKKK